ncbi:uncharacterized protein LOC124254487 [Haliotis rubra]|uniref:uncharacterized protein LOC124254487 n=1 Tax=Haliotis rubra TaxID=36100 RepID=UPI001EE55316|nr:uncharacterized protein LOC124254487 [Haliotis rubra]
MGKKARNREARRSIRERARQWAANIARTFLSYCLPCVRGTEVEAQCQDKSLVDRKSPQPVQEEVTTRPAHRTRYLNLKGVLHPQSNDYPWSGENGMCECGGIGYHPVITSGSEFRIQDHRDTMAARSKSATTQVKDAVTSGGLPDCRYSVMGNFNQGTVAGIVGPSENAGTQCTSMAYTAVVASAFLPVGIWSRNTLDTILQLGDQLHEQILTNMGNNAPQNRFLAFDELPHKPRIGAFRWPVKCAFGPEHQGVISANGDHNSEIERYLKETFGEGYSGCLMTFDGMTSAVLQNNDETYSVFDSHGRNIMGMIDGEGQASLLRFTSLIDVAKHVSGQARDVSLYGLVGVKVKTRDTP